jgi:hypothetical protein
MAKKDKIMESWKTKIHKSALVSLAEADTTSTTKYLEYMYRMWHSTRPLNVKPRNTKVLIDYVKKFDSLIPYLEVKDIYSKKYSDWLTFVDAIHDAELIKEEKEFVKEDHVHILFENDEYIFLKPLTHRGSLKYGAGTKWCTAAKDYPNTFRNYIGDGYLFYVNRKITKGTDWDKVAFYVSHDGDGVLFNEVQTFCAKDIQHDTRSLQKCDWSIEDIMKFHHIARQFAWESEKRKQAKESILHTTKVLNSINFSEIQKNFELLKQTDEIEDILTQFRKTIESFTEKVKF